MNTLNAASKEFWGKDDSDVRDPIKYLRERELVHYQRFGDALRIAQDRLDSKNFYAFNPEFDKGCGCSH